jgi:glycosyltransferase involved in cell wall biosynthesis
MISKKRIEDHNNLYQRFNIPSHLLNKISHIPNAIKLPARSLLKNDQPFTVLYVGRGTEEKRVDLVAKTAKELHKKKENIRFEILGDISGAIKETDYPFINFYGNISNEEKISEIYSKAHVLILTSTTEGFPMVIMEAMAHGCIILSTAVGDIPYHVKDKENGFLFSNTNDEVAIINEGIKRIIWLNNNRNEVNRMAANNIEYAKHNFGIERFNKDYRELFLSVNPKS